MECQDCNKKEADTIVFNLSKLDLFGVCRDCIKEGDYICPENLINKLMNE